MFREVADLILRRQGTSAESALHCQRLTGYLGERYVPLTVRTASIRKDVPAYATEAVPREVIPLFGLSLKRRFQSLRIGTPEIWSVF